MERAIILGASRGLGAELVKVMCSAMYPVMGFGRKAHLLAALKEKYLLFEHDVADFSSSRGQDRVLKHLIENDYSKVFCVAGGGPYGLFQDRQMKDHDWAMEVTYHFPARVAHALLVAKKNVQLIFLGSSVAENSADPCAASYAAAKHALKGLFYSLKAENPSFDVRLFSPGYLDTDLLPQGAEVREKGVYSPGQIAHELWEWTNVADDTGHKVYSIHPE